ncbi:hypothetical protein ABT390_36795 [Streptomyces aurantiacus]|uniref:Uncharacterized protein n=1 Tax=Streptomyces aurantiacus JA 4570 TaxID=1286094 RepID=S3ZE11_9ACTN|nr:hypothetical protein [Streptomyces aurantiacus]EPH40894.1 hypothetical protein STRAU_6109 [Streptomyces aurantiacus JA 4570]
MSENPAVETAARVIAAAIVHGTSTDVAREVAQCLDDARLLVQRTAPVDGPFRVYVEPIPTGVTLDVEAFVQHVVYDIVELLLGDKYGDRFDGLVDVRSRDPHLIERPGDLPFECLVADLVADVGTKMPVYRPQVLRLAEQMLVRAAPQAIPGQRAEGGAAA